MNKLAVERDRLRERHDIRNKQKLSSYQKTQLRDIEKQISDHSNKELRNKIFNTFD
jgi:hypothetical protein